MKLRIDDYNPSVFQNRRLNEKELRKYIKEFGRKMDEICWENVSQYQHLTDRFMLEFQDKLNWRLVSKFQKLSGKIIYEVQNKLDFYCWSNISEYQMLSKYFLYKFKDNIYWNRVFEYYQFDEKFLISIKDEIKEKYESITILIKTQKLSPTLVVGLELYEYFWVVDYIRKEYRNFKHWKEKEKIIETLRLVEKMTG